MGDYANLIISLLKKTVLDSTELYIPIKSAPLNPFELN